MFSCLCVGIAFVGIVGYCLVCLGGHGVGRLGYRCCCVTIVCCALVSRVLDAVFWLVLGLIHSCACGCASAVGQCCCLAFLCFCLCFLLMLCPSLCVLSRWWLLCPSRCVVLSLSCLMHRYALCIGCGYAVFVPFSYGRLQHAQGIASGIGLCRPATLNRLPALFSFPLVLSFCIRVAVSRTLAVIFQTNNDLDILAGNLMPQ